MGWHLDDHVELDLGRVACGTAGNGPPLVLAHGWPWSSYAWSKVIPALADHFTVHWYDMPGFGQSEKALDRPTDLAAQGRIFAEMLEHWALDRPNVWAHDFGGAITMRASLLHGCRYARYLLMNVVAVRPWGSEFFAHVGRHVAAFEGLPPHIHKAVVAAYIDSALANGIDAGDRVRLIAPWIDGDGQRAFYRQFAQADERLTEEIEPRFADLPQPVHVLWGEDDPWIPAARGRTLADMIGCGFEPLRGAGHLPQLERPDRTLRAALKHLTGEMSS